MTQTFLKGTTPTVHRVDLSCEQTGFTTPPFDVHIKFLPSPVPGEGWTLLAHVAAGKAEIVSRWLQTTPGIGQVRIAQGLAPKLFRAKVAVLPAAWAHVASFARVHHLDLAADGHASWFIEGMREQILALVQSLESTVSQSPAASNIRCRPVVNSQSNAPITRRQFEALSTAVALGYYEIPHRLDLRKLASLTGLSLGSVSELLRRAEGAILTHYVDANMMAWPQGDVTDQPTPYKPITNLLRS